MFACTLDYDKTAKNVQKAEATPNYVNKSTHTKVTLNMPFGTTDYPELLPIYNGINSAMDALNKFYHIEGTRLITLKNKAHLFQHRLDRVRLLCNQLIFRMAVYHVSYFRKEHKDNFPPSSKPFDLIRKSPSPLSVTSSRNWIKKPYTS